MKEKTEAVSTAAVVKRVRRLLAKDKKILVASHQCRGTFNVVDSARTIELLHANIEAIAHRLGVLKPWESIQ